MDINLNKSQPSNANKENFINIWNAKLRLTQGQIHIFPIYTLNIYQSDVFIHDGHCREKSVFTGTICYKQTFSKIPVYFVNEKLQVYYLVLS